MTKPQLTEQIISQLYRATGLGDIAGFRRQALTELAQVIAFDGALWGTGNINSEDFHSVDVLGISERYPADLVHYIDDNPIFLAYKNNPGVPVSMDEVVVDEVFYQSDLYQQLFFPHGIERIIGIVLTDDKTGISNLISLYRFERDKLFTPAERDQLQRMSFHMIQSVSHRCFMHTTVQSIRQKSASLAICDKHGLFYQIEADFLALLEVHFPHTSHHCLPFNINELPPTICDNKLQVSSTPLGDLYCIMLRETRPYDLLSAREQEVVDAVVQGLSFKEAARVIGVAPSTVSNHLYRIYRKLDISSRTELAELIHQAD